MQDLLAFVLPLCSCATTPGQDAIPSLSPPPSPPSPRTIQYYNYPFILLGGEIGTVGLICLAQEHNTAGTQHRNAARELSSELSKGVKNATSQAAVSPIQHPLETACEERGGLYCDMNQHDGKTFQFPRELEDITPQV